MSIYIDCNVLNDGLLLRITIFALTEYFKCVSSFKSNIVKNDSPLYEENINQAFILSNYCTLYINISVFNDCLLTLTVMSSMMVYFWVLLYLHWLTISNEYPVSNKILLRMTALFTKKFINQSFLLFNYCTLYINISVFNDCLLTLTVMFSVTVYFWGLPYLHWLTISNEFPVSNPILLRMTALFTEKAYEPSVSSFLFQYWLEYLLSSRK